MGQGPKAKTKRNEEIYKLREAGKSWGEIAKAYNITRARVVFIHKRIKDKKI